MNKKEVGKFVYKTRKLMHITQVELSKKTKMSQGKISKVERGILELSVSEFVSVLGVFCLKLDIVKEKL